MPQNKPAWTGYDLYLRIYASDNLGTKIGGDDAIALLDFCFVNAVTVQGSGQSVLRDRECKDKRELVTAGAWDNYTATVSSLYIAKADEYLADTIFSPGYWLYIEFLLASEFARGLGKDDDLHVLTKCHATGFSISGRDADFVSFDASFLGTEFS